MIRFPVFPAVAAAAFAFASFFAVPARAETPAPAQLHVAFVGDSMADGCAFG